MSPAHNRVAQAAPRPGDNPSLLRPGAQEGRDLQLTRMGAENLDFQARPGKSVSSEALGRGLHRSIKPPRKGHHTKAARAFSSRQAQQHRFENSIRPTLDYDTFRSRLHRGKPNARAVVCRSNNKRFKVGNGASKIPHRAYLRSNSSNRMSICRWSRISSASLIELQVYRFLKPTAPSPPASCKIVFTVDDGNFEIFCKIDGIG